MGEVESEIISSFLITFWCPSKPHCKWLQSLRMKFKVKTSQLINRHKISPSARYCAKSLRHLSPSRQDERKSEKDKYLQKRGATEKF